MRDRKSGLGANILATRVLPGLIPQMVNQNLDLETYLNLQSCVLEMVELVDRSQRTRLGLEVKPSLRAEKPTELMPIPDLVIRRPSVVQVNIENTCNLVYCFHC